MNRCFRLPSLGVWRIVFSERRVRRGEIAEQDGVPNYLEHEGTRGGQDLSDQVGKSAQPERPRHRKPRGGAKRAQEADSTYEKD